MQDEDLRVRVAVRSGAVPGGLAWTKNETGTPPWSRPRNVRDSSFPGSSPFWMWRATPSTLAPRRSYPARMDLQFSGELWHWRGPSPFHFVTVPDGEAEAIKEVSGRVSYGWGVIPVTARIEDTEWTTSLFPKDGGYVVPVKDAVRRAEAVEIGDVVTVRLRLDV